MYENLKIFSYKCKNKFKLHLAGQSKAYEAKQLSLCLNFKTVYLL